MGGASIGERGCATARSICYSRCGSSSESAPRRYGAIAFSKSTLGHGSSRNVHSRSEAEARAIEDCRANAASAADCQVMVFFYDHCGALAVGGRGAYGSDHGPSRRAAASKALAHCRPYDGDTCRAVREVCSP